METILCNPVGRLLRARDEVRVPHVLPARSQPQPRDNLPPQPCGTLQHPGHRTGTADSTPGCNQERAVFFLTTGEFILVLVD